VELRVRLFAIAAVILLTACTTTTPPTTTPAPANDLARFIDEATARSPFDRAIWGIHIEDDDGTVLYSRNAHSLLQPASNRKLFAAATIANCLGVDTRLTTEVFLDEGDVIVRGDGDPSLGSWRFAREDDFDGIAKVLESRGVTRALSRWRLGGPAARQVHARGEFCAGRARTRWVDAFQR
jgi:D-alanyl-D-alanine carboxypeptidase